MLLAGILFALGQAPQAGAPDGEPPLARGWDDFPVFVWREKYAGQPLPEELAEPFGGVILMREEDSAWARERGLSYLVWNVAGRDALHLDADETWNARVEKWIETHDEKLLVREPCLNDPKTLEKLFATLDATIAKHGEHPGLGFVLGDEVGLTPNGDPFDLCRCDHCETRWREYARESRLPERAPLTDEVRLALLEDDFSVLGAWLVRRRFDRARLSEILQELSERVHSSSSTPVGLLGIGGPTAFGGIDLSRGLSFADFVEAYPVNDAREILSAFPRSERRSRASLATVFVGTETPDGAAWKVWEHWLRGGSALVLWSDQELLASPEHTLRLTATVARIREIERRYRLWTGFDRIAVVHDADSIALSWLKDALLDGATWPRRRSGYQAEHGTREKSVRSWLRALEDAGALPVSVSLKRLHELCFGGCNTLVLAHLLVLGPNDVVRLEQQLDSGATLVVDGPLGWVDRTGQPWKEDVLARLRARAPERVVSVPEHLEDRLSSRRPVFSGEAAKVPWLISSRTDAFSDHVSEDQLVIALPNPTQPGARAARSMPLDIKPPAGHRLHWIYPRHDGELREGDAAVFLLQRID